MKKSKKLTPRQKMILVFISEYSHYYLEMPTFGEIAESQGICRSTTFAHVSGLIQKGYLTSQGTIRGLEFTDKAIKLLENWTLVWVVFSRLLFYHATKWLPKI